MKRIKYIISFCVIFIGILIIGESHILCLDNFYTQYDNTTLYLQTGMTSEEMVNDILNAAAVNEVEVFTFKTSRPSISSDKYDIYGTSGAEKYINENSSIYEKKYTSLFLGNVSFEFNDIKSIQGIENIHDYYIIGSKEQVHQFKMDLIDKYGGNHPKQGYVDNESRNNTVAIWIIIISIILLLSFYDVISRKKENIVRVSMGEKISKIIWENVLLDSLVFIVSFIVIVCILSRYTDVFFYFNISIILFTILLCFNGLLYLNLYFYDLKEVFSNSKSSKKLLSLNYGLKLVTTIITIFVISSNIAFISESYSLYKQKPFFKNHSDYYYIKLGYKPIQNSDGSFNDRWDETVNVQATFYREFLEKYNATTIKNISSFLGTGGISANKNSFEYLSSKIDELKDVNLDKDIYFILPEKTKDKSKIIETLDVLIKFTEGYDFTYDYHVIYYHDNINIVGIDEDTIYGSNLVKNPIILYNNTSPNGAKQQNEDIYSSVLKADDLNDTMYKISSDDEFDKFLYENNLQDQIVIKTNVLEKYENSLVIAKRILYINLVFSILVLLLEIIIINSIIRLEYEVNAIELSIKKVMGYSILEKNKKIILMTVVTTISSIVVAVVGATIMNLQEALYLVVGGFVILILELFVIIFHIEKIENSKVQKILKGGNL